MSVLDLNLTLNRILNRNPIKSKIMITLTTAIRRVLPVVFVLATPVALVAADETNATAARPDYQSFRVIYERNIFNPNRSGRGDYRSYTRREPDRRGRSTAFGLVGTMSYEKGRFAFFDGTSSEYRKVLQADESIAGYKLVEVGPNYVTLHGDGKEVHLEVGGRMRRQDGEWSLGSNGESFESFTSETTETPAGEGEKTETASTTAASANEPNDVLKRLMQKREQELQNEKK